MNTQTFLNLLNDNKDKDLIFEYAKNKQVGANYHITEVKHITIDSVDCGARTDTWNETIIQLWESPKELDKRDFMKVYKALAILNKVGGMRPYDLTAEIKIEYSNATFHTTQQFIDSIDVNDSNMIVKLSLDKTSCKASDICGVKETPKLEVTESGCCEPSDGSSSNCC